MFINKAMVYNASRWT